MKPLSSKTNASALLLCLFPIILSCAVLAQSQEQQPSSSAPAEQKGFKTPQLAAEALIKAAESYDVPALLEIFGPHGKDFIQSADPVNDKNVIQKFAEKARERHLVNVEKGTAVLQIGKEYWLLSVLIVKRQG